MSQSKELAEEYRINKLNSLMDKLILETSRLEEYYLFEVREK